MTINCNRQTKSTKNILSLFSKAKMNGDCESAKILKYYRILSFSQKNIKIVLSWKVYVLSYRVLIKNDDDLKIVRHM